MGYEKEDMAQEFDLQTFVGSNSERASVELSIAMSYCLVIIKLYVIAEMENHLSKRERFLTFMQGTHPRLGSHSNVIRIAGMTPAVRLISKYCDISTNPLNIPSIQISPSSLSLNQRINFWPSLLFRQAGLRVAGPESCWRGCRTRRGSCWLGWPGTSLKGLRKSDF